MRKLKQRGMKCFTQVHTENNWQSWPVHQGGLFPKSEVTPAAFYLFWNLIRDSLSGTRLSNLLFSISPFCLRSLPFPSRQHHAPHHPSPVTQAINQSQNPVSLTSLNSLCCYIAHALHFHSTCPLHGCLGHRKCLFTDLSTAAFLAERCRHNSSKRSKLTISLICLKAFMISATPPPPTCKTSGHRGNPSGFGVCCFSLALSSLGSILLGHLLPTPKRQQFTKSGQRRRFEGAESLNGTHY